MDSNDWNYDLKWEFISLQETEMNRVTELFDMDKYGEDEVVEALNEMSPDEQLEYLKILEKMYYSCQSSNLGKLLRRLLMDDHLRISNLLRLQIVYLFEKDMPTDVRDRIYTLLMTTDDEGTSNTMEITCQFDVLKYMFSTFPETTSLFAKVLENILSRPSLDEDFRYRSLLDSRKLLGSKDEFTRMLKRCFDGRVFSTRNMLLMCQYMMNHRTDYDTGMMDISRVIEYMVSVMMDEDMCDANRVDVADILLNLESDVVDEQFKDMAINIIGQRSNEFSFYHNQENVHYVDTTSIQSILDYLNQTYKSLCTIDDDITRRNVMRMDTYTQLNEKEKERVHVALVRIQNDRSSYGAQHNTLSEIMRMILQHIRHHRHQHELEKRLMEELIDMSGKCATGYVIRLVNVLSGFDDNFHVRIPPEQAMKSVLFNRLNALMLDIDNDDQRNEVLYEITLPSSFPHLRRNFLAFFRQVFPSLKEEMYEQFKDEMTDTDFDLYLRRIVINYEGYE